MSAVPTGASISPDTYSIDYAWYAGSDGGVSVHYVSISSYGRKSPAPDASVNAWQVLSFGDTVYFYYIYDSYGSPDTNNYVSGYFMLVVYGSGSVGSYGRDIDYSYGKYAPDTYMGGSEGVMQVTDYGDIQFETWLHVSYGIL